MTQPANTKCPVCGGPAAPYSKTLLRCTDPDCRFYWQPCDMTKLTAKHLAFLKAVDDADRQGARLSRYADRWYSTALAVTAEGEKYGAEVNKGLVEWKQQLEEELAEFDGWKDKKHLESTKAAIRKHLQRATEALKDYKASYDSMKKWNGDYNNLEPHTRTTEILFVLINAHYLFMQIAIAAEVHDLLREIDIYPIDSEEKEDIVQLFAALTNIESVESYHEKGEGVRIDLMLSEIYVKVTLYNLVCLFSDIFAAQTVAPDELDEEDNGEEDEEVRELNEKMSQDIYKRRIQLATLADMLAQRFLATVSSPQEHNATKN